MARNSYYFPLRRPGKGGNGEEIADFVDFLRERRTKTGLRQKKIVILSGKSIHNLSQSMKKILLLGFMQVFCAWAIAQTSVETAQPISPGEISYDFANASGDKYVYYTYTAGTASDELLVLRRVTSGVSYVISQNGASSTAYTQIKGESGAVVYVCVPKGQKVYISANAYKVSNITFNFKTVAVDASQGNSCSNPVTLIKGRENYLPATTGDLSYMEYTATESGTLSLTMTSNLSGLGVSEGCDGTTTSLSQGTDSYWQTLVKTQVKAGKTYIFSGKAYNPVVATVSVEASADEGISCDNPFQGKETGNVLPAAAGTYWYSYITTDETILHVAGGPQLPGGRAALYTSCSDSRPTVEAIGYLGLRTRLLGNKQYLLCVEKKQSTASDETFDLLGESAQAGDSFDNPIALTAGSHATPDHNGVTYYSVSAPAGQPSIITISCNATIGNENTYMSLFAANDETAPLGTSTRLLSVDAAAGDAYIVKWSCQEGYNAIPFDVEIRPIQPGESLDNPLAAHVGYNEVSEGREVRYFTYTASAEGWLSVQPAAGNVSVGLWQTDGSRPYLAFADGENGLRTEAWAGASYLIKLDGVAAGSGFTLTETAYGDGETCDLAWPVADVAELPSTPGNHWYAYTAPADGMLTIACNIDNEYDGDTQSASGVSYKQGSCSAAATAIKVTSGNVPVKYQQTIAVTGGQLLLINARTLSPLEGRKLSLTWREFAEGESPATALPLKIGENVLRAATPAQPIWYAIDLAPCNFVMSTLTSANYFKGAIYLASAPTSMIDESYYETSADGTDGTYRITLTVEKPTSYLIKATQSTEGMLVNVEGVIATGIKTATEATAASFHLQDGLLSATASTTVYDLSGKCVARIPAGGSAKLAGGVYLLRSGDRTCKVLVK